MDTSPTGPEQSMLVVPPISQGGDTCTGLVVLGGPMAEIIETHPAWEDWAGAGPGVLIALTPNFVSETVDRGVKR